MKDSIKGGCQGGPIGQGSKAARECRAYRARTTRVVRRAAASVISIFGKASVPKFSSGAVTCELFQKDVKAYISTVPACLKSIEEGMAWLSLKKLLPSSCRCLEGTMLGSLEKRLTRKSRDLPRGYLQFVERQTRKMFRKGWDSRYQEYVEKYNPGLGATADSSRSNGGGAVELARMGRDLFVHRCTCRNPYCEYENCVISGYSMDDDDKIQSWCRADAMVIQSAGKPRALTKFPAEYHVLGPLHESIYDRLSKERWLLRGDVDPVVLSRAGFSKGKPLVSGDYQSATDNLPIEVAELILRTLRDQAIECPKAVFGFAERALRPTISYEDEEGDTRTFVPTMGQMMGSKLSFPLLCLQNYFALLWAEEKAGYKTRTHPCLINGDDILFQAEASFYHHWLEVVGAVGLEVERTKTSIDIDYGTINSTLLRWDTSGCLYVVPTFRLGMLRRPEYPHALGTTWRKFVAPAVGRRQRFVASCVFLRFLRSVIINTGLSACALGFVGRLFVGSAKAVDLWDRECRMSSMEAQVELPRDNTPHNIVWDPDEMVKVPQKVFDNQPDLREENMKAGTLWRWNRLRQFTGETQKEVKERWTAELSRKLSSARLRAETSSSKTSSSQYNLTEDFQGSMGALMAKRRFVGRRIETDEKMVLVFSSAWRKCVEWETSVLPLYSVLDPSPMGGDSPPLYTE